MKIVFKAGYFYFPIYKQARLRFYLLSKYFLLGGFEKFGSKDWI
jgi:hypothetical protein